MGIDIGYRGTLDDLSRLDKLIADVRMFCEAAGWEAVDFSQQISGVGMMTADDFMKPSRKKSPAEKVEDWPEEETMVMGNTTIRFNPKNAILLEETWRGIIASPPGTESLMLTFDGKGRLCNYMEVPRKWVKGPLRNEKHYLCFPLACRTTGQVEEHIAICMLLRMLRPAYMKNLKVDDSTGYYKTRDENKLHRDHAMMAGLIGAFKSSPEFLKIVLTAAGVPEEVAETAVPLPTNFAIKIPKSGGTPKKRTVH